MLNQGQSYVTVSVGVREYGGSFHLLCLKVAMLIH